VCSIRLLFYLLTYLGTMTVKPTGLDLGLGLEGHLFCLGPGPWPGGPLALAFALKMLASNPYLENTAVHATTAARHYSS